MGESETDTFRNGSIFLRQNTGSFYGNEGPVYNVDRAIEQTERKGPGADGWAAWVLPRAG